MIHPQSDWLKHPMFNWKKFFPNSYNTSYGFLLDVTSYIILHLDNLDNTFEDAFREKCYEHRLFATKKINDETQNEDELIFYQVHRFLRDLQIVFEYVGCTCHNKTIDKWLPEVKLSLKELIQSLCFNKENFQKIIKGVDLPSCFIEECRLKLDSSHANITDLEVAQKDLLNWIDVVNDKFIQYVLIALQMNYISEKI